MSLTTTLRLTQFTVQKLRCCGDRRRATLYQVSTYDAMELGSIGLVMESEMEASNAINFAQHGPQGMRRLLDVFAR